MQVAEENNIISENLTVVSNPEIGHDRKLHDLFSIIIGEVSNLHSGGHSIRGKLIDLEKKQYVQQFQSWCMPVQRTGYIKARVHDFL
jgi:hypothetical protein